jgi:NtrC-family two-component system sensor histidine kinase KinB
MIPRGLRLRFVVAAGLLVLTTVTASIFTFVALTGLSRTVTNTVRESETVTSVTSKLAGAMEREDDAVLLALSGDARATSELARERATVDEAVAQLFDVLEPPEERELASPLQEALRAYRRASDGVIAIASEQAALVQYHQQANPLLRRAVTLTNAIRDRHFEAARQAVTSARDEASGARRAVLLITLAALAIAVAVAWHLTTTVVTPLRRLTRGADAIRQGRFAERIDVETHDELGELASTFNHMAADLAEFRRTNVGEVVRAKNALEATLEALPDAVVLFDANCRIQSMNRAATEVLEAAGVRAPETLADLTLDGLDRPHIGAAIAAGADLASPIDLSRTIRLERQGTIQRLLPRVVSVPGLRPQQAGAILLLSDVTDIARLDEMRSELVAVASHELQTPLTTLRMTLLMMQEAAEGLPAPQQELLATSLMGVEQLDEIVHEFLDLTRIEAGELRLDLEPVPASVLIAESLRRARTQAAAQDITLTSQEDPNLPPIVADARRLRVVLDNLLSNALKYTPAGGRVTVANYRTASSGVSGDESVAISVTDTGPGIPAAFRSRIFDKFFRLEHDQAHDRPHARGAGIGLYMCRQIVQLHGGRITCTAGADNAGTCVTVELPIAANVLVSDRLATS